MKWEEIREKFPEQWLLLESTSAYSEGDKRIVEEFSVIDTFPDSISAMHKYGQLHQEDPWREYYVLHTDRKEPDIRERFWLGIRGRRHGIHGFLENHTERREEDTAIHREKTRLFSVCLCASSV